jgi:hypothetical protein
MLGVASPVHLQRTPDEGGIKDLKREEKEMKGYIVSAVVFLSLLSAQAQVVRQRQSNQPFPIDNRPLSGEEWRLQLVERLMSLPSPVTNGAPQLYGMGDEAAVDVIKVLSTKPSLTPAEVQAGLDIIHMAFEHPESIISPVNRKPQAALFVMKHFASATDDSVVKERIAQETTRLAARMVVAAAKPVAPQQ